MLGGYFRFGLLYVHEMTLKLVGFRVLVVEGLYLYGIVVGHVYVCMLT